MGGKGKILSLLALTMLASILPLRSVSAASQRCPAEAITGAAATPGESAEIVALWHDLGDGAGSDGPLGCPMGNTTPLSDSGFDGISQKFQRGWILIGRGGSNGVEIAAVRGLNGWTVWWKGLEFGLLVSDVEPINIDKTKAATANATWSHGGFVQVTLALGDVALWQCRPVTCGATSSVTHWYRITPKFNGISRPFDAAARLDANLLALADAKRFSARVTAMFPSWIPCYTLLSGSPEPGEDEFARADLMLGRAAPCPLTATVPRDAILNWLTNLTFPEGWVPGTSSDTAPCKRDGELDVAMAQLLRLMYRHQSGMSAVTRGHLLDILQKWGGKPRLDPYVTPEGTCLGFAVIESENHILLQESSRYLINQLLIPRNLGADFDNSANRDWLLRFMQQIARRDFYEFNALPYTRYQSKALLNLNDAASDAAVATAATGLLHWLFAKAAISGNMDRDQRPFRRRPEPDRYSNTAWWGGAATATATEAAMLAGPLQHVHEDIDLLFDKGKDDTGDDAYADVVNYPELGAAGENFLAELTDIRDTSYRLPSALVGWLERRYSNDFANRAVYVQGLRHTSKVSDDKGLFAQFNEGVELVSGNRNWTIVAGGVPVAPGDPGPPPESTGATVGYGLAGVAVGAAVGAAIGGAVGGAPGAVVGAVIGAIAGLFGAEEAPDVIAANKQHDKLWEDQIAVMRETMLIPTAIGLNRSQTLRFGEPEKTAEGQVQYARLCVANGFMCGYDLHLPSHPFAVKDATDCPNFLQALPNELDALVKAPALPGSAPLSSFLRCPIPGGGYQKEWAIWAYEFGTLSMALGDLPGPARTIYAWIESGPDYKNRKLHVHWKLPGRSHNWYDAHVYNRAVMPSGSAPDGDLQLSISGNPDDSDNTSDTGDAVFPIDDGNQDATWDILVEACDPTYGFLGIRTGHQCHADVLPKLTVTVAVPPRQSFSCDSMVDNQVSQSQSIVMQVGDCKGGPYGMFVYLWTHACPPSLYKSQLGRNAPLCPDGATNYGFVVVAPSRGWTMQGFAGSVDAGMVANLSGGHDYLPGGPSAGVGIPISPPVQQGADGKWRPVPGAPADAHTITFRWPTPDNASILSDTASPGLYGPLAADWRKWPTAAGALSVPDVPGIPTGAAFIRNSGDGCIAIPGLPLPSNPDPTGLVVDLRNASAPVVKEIPDAAVAGACP